MDYNKIIKKIVFFFLVIFIQQNITLANIIYDKNDILITELELEEFKKLYFQNKKIELRQPKAIKELVLLKKTVKELEKKQPKVLESLDKIILEEFGESKIKNPIIKDFLRYYKIRNEFTIQYFNNELKIDDIEFTLNSFSELNMPISSNGCKTINDFINLKDSKEFSEILFENFKKKQFVSNLEIEINNEKFNVCINKKFFLNIEKELINYIEVKTENRFKAFIYEK